MRNALSYIFFDLFTYPRGCFYHMNYSLNFRSVGYQIFVISRLASRSRHEPPCAAPCVFSHWCECAGP